MKILDEELTRQITYASNCEATFKVYKKSILFSLLGYLFTAIAAISGFLYLVLNYPIEGPIFILIILAILSFVCLGKAIRLAFDYSSNLLAGL